MTAEECAWIQSEGTKADQERVGFAHSRVECIALVKERCPDASVARCGIIDSFEAFSEIFLCSCQ